MFQRIELKSDVSSLIRIHHLSTSVNRWTLNYRNKMNPPDTPSIPIKSPYMSSDLNTLLTYKLPWSEW